MLSVEKRGHVLWARLSQPKRSNALSSWICESFWNLAARVEDEIDIRCVVITGSGKAFCAGADLKERGALPAEERWRYVSRLNKVIERLDTLPVPVVAAINGYAMGGGVELAAIADFRFASRQAIFALPEVRWGIIPGGSVVRLFRDVSPSIAAKLAFTGDRMSAEEALRYGLVDAVYETNDILLVETETLTQQIVKNAPLALRAAKRLLRGVSAEYSADAMRLAMTLRAPLEDTEDSVEGLHAFAEKREPIFQGR